MSQRDWNTHKKQGRRGQGGYLPPIKNRAECPFSKSIKNWSLLSGNALRYERRFLKILPSVYPLKTNYSIHLSMDTEAGKSELLS